ncbi:alpha/beta hydrolase [Rhizobium laguerreae]|uniref:Alpha/beta hydrolase n=1 Tax=Rhizobium laguerreae TaxID=1076926 RepID=A0AB35FDQ0_9HYPH|nr:alpha/beta hydrolase [Rhizobium laguerreae]MBY3064784.1 alpha/beta hydrolase [Rhizobium laguerreae]
MNVGSARVAYRVVGMGPAVLLVNGTGGGDGHWGDLIERLARSRTVVTLDYSGAGETTDDGAPLDLLTLARQVSAVAEAISAPFFDLVGHSLGAAIATVLAAEQPEMVRTLTLVAGFLTADDPRLKLTFQLWRRLIATDREGFIQVLALTTLSDRFFTSPLAAHLDALAQGILNGTNWEGLARQVELDLRVDIREVASRVRCPTLVVGCAHDQIVSHTHDLCDLIPGATFSEIHAGHQAYFEASEEFAAKFVAFSNGPHPQSPLSSTAF